MGIPRTAAVLLTALLLLSPAARSFGRQTGARIADVKLHRGAQGDLAVDFRVEGIVNDRVLDTLDSGIPVRFTYWVRVVHPRGFLRDETLADLQLVRELEKDNLKDRFRVSLGGRGEWRDVPDLQQAIDLMARVENVSVLPLDVLGSQAPLELRIKAQLQKFQLPFRLHYLFAFVSYWDVETDWYTVTLPTKADALP
jgi:hypothetical protein